MTYRLTACLIAAALATPAVAQQYNTTSSSVWGPTAGDWEVGLGGGGTSDEDFETGGFNTDIDLGYYLTDELAVALRQSVNYNDAGAGTAWSASSRVALDYHFPLFDNRLRPFVGVNFGYVYGDSVDDTFAAGPEAGVKWYVKDDAFLFGRAEYQFLFEDGDEAEDNFDDGIWLYTVGIGLNF
jgi:outer membrane protein W